MHYKFSSNIIETRSLNCIFLQETALSNLVHRTSAWKLVFCAVSLTDMHHKETKENLAC